MQTKTTTDEIKAFVLERIEDIIAGITDLKKSLGKDYDQNSYGAGYDEGELTAYKSVRDILNDE